MENVVIYSGNVEYFAHHWVYFLAFGNCVVIGYIFSPLWYFVPRKIWQPWSERRLPLNFRYEKTFLGSLFRAHKKAATFFSQKKKFWRKKWPTFCPAPVFVMGQFQRTRLPSYRRPFFAFWPLTFRFADLFSSENVASRKTLFRGGKF
jgi:hypothetical protein